MKMRRWTKKSAELESNCPYYEAAADVQEPKVREFPQMTVSKIMEFLKKTDDIDIIKALRHQEESSDSPRVTALKAIEDRLKELTEGDAK